MGNGRAEEAAPSRRGLVAAIAAGLVVVLAAGCGGGDEDGQGARRPSSEEGDGGDTTEPSTTPETTATLPPPPTNPPPRPLPGLTTQAAIDGLGGAGWTCTVETGMYPDHLQHGCDDAGAGAWLDMVSTQAGEVLSVDVYGYEDGLGAFTEVASLGWTGVDGGEVAAWIDSSVGGATTVVSNSRLFGDVPFSFIGDPASVMGNWSLQIGRAPTV